MEVRVLTPAGFPELDPNVTHQLLFVDPGSWSAFTISWAGNSLIVHNPTHSEGRQESNIFHELAHLLCDHRGCQLEVVNGIPMRTYDASEEEEAGWLGGALHLPRIALIRCIADGVDDDEIAARFVASDELVAFRRRMTGVDSQLRRRRVRVQN
ncbi:MAG: ImmA/IrrE family metallo-endopeptidase [Fimbriimonadaceae bacterium]